jgi:hypothetical protein
MKRVCVFCGVKPASKSREHVLPKWLIRLTGDPNRNFGLWVDFSNGKQRVFPAKEFTFPACLECNTSYSSFELDVKRVVTKILVKESLDRLELDHLLDWLDKVRIGLWLGYRYLDKNMFGIEPNYHIAKRIGRSDRFLQFYRIPGARDGLTFHGVNSPIFAHMPSCFGLRINDVYFFNASTTQLLSRRAGFPFLAEPFSDTEGTVHGEEKLGLGRLMLPLIRSQFIRSDISIYQPISPLLDDDLFVTPWVSEHRLEMTKRKGFPIVRKGAKVSWMDESSRLQLDDIDRPDGPKLMGYRLAAQVFSYQKHLLLNSIPMRFENPDDATAYSYDVKRMKEVQSIMINKCSQGIMQIMTK